ncbi:MAG: hypothetical protein ABH821_03570, partial [archaeon]
PSDKIAEQTYAVKVNVVDEESGDDMDASSNLYVNTSNLPPVAVLASIPEEEALLGNTVDFSAYGSDDPEDGYFLTYDWTLSVGDVSYEMNKCDGIENPGEVYRECYVKFEEGGKGAGTYLMKVKVTDLGGLSDTAEDYITINKSENNTPEVDIINETNEIDNDEYWGFLVDREITLSAQAKDSENEIESYTWFIDNQPVTFCNTPIPPQTIGNWVEIPPCKVQFNDFEEKTYNIKVRVTTEDELIGEDAGSVEIVSCITDLEQQVPSEVPESGRHLDIDYLNENGNNITVMVSKDDLVYEAILHDETGTENDNITYSKEVFNSSDSYFNDSERKGNNTLIADAFNEDMEMGLDRLIEVDDSGNLVKIFTVSNMTEPMSIQLMSSPMNGYMLVSEMSGNQVREINMSTEAVEWKWGFGNTKFFDAKRVGDMQNGSTLVALIGQHAVHEINHLTGDSVWSYDFPACRENIRVERLTESPRLDIVGATKNKGVLSELHLVNDVGVEEWFYTSDNHPEFKRFADFDILPDKRLLVLGQGDWENDSEPADIKILNCGFE